ncbi:MAG: hypothetical protein HYY84_04645 [Deltaproteobacteria bacterium]|nr:hypothetical protein [Deltaproteobacteria bacterium]
MKEAERRLGPMSLGVRNVLVVLVVAGVAVFGVTLFQSPTAAWSSLLVAAFYFLTIALGAIAFLALTYITKAGWSSVVKRVPEAMSTFLPVGAGLTLTLLLGIHSLYHWSHPDAVAHDAILTAKAGYLNAPFFAGRMVVVLGLWLLFGWLFRRNSLRQDADAAVHHTRRNVALAAGYLFLFAFTFSVAGIDWLMSLEPHWFSTIFGIYNLAGLLLGGFASIAVVTILLRRAGYLPNVNENHLHDLGKLTFAMSVFWAYIWISQYMLIWYSNLPEETTYYLRRTEGGWAFLFYFNVVINWVVPFVVLLPRPGKRSEANLLRVSLAVLGGRFLDIYLMVAPANSTEHGGVGIVDVTTFLGVGALFVLIVYRALARRSLIPRGDPYLIEGLHHKQ